MRYSLVWQGNECKCVTEHRPTPPFVDEHHIDPLYRGGPDEDGNIVIICGATHAWVHKFYRAFEKAGKITPRPLGWPRFAYEIAKDGWARWEARNTSG